MSESFDPLMLTAAAVFLFLVPLASAIGVWHDARRRVPPGEAAVWGLTNLLAFPAAFPAYLWRAYVRPHAVPQPFALLPWVRACVFLTASLVVLMAGGLGAAVIDLLLRLLPSAWLGEGARILIAAGLGQAPVMIVWCFVARRWIDREPAFSIGCLWQGGRSLRETAIGLAVGLAGPALFFACLACLAPVSFQWRLSASSVTMALVLALPLLLAAFQEEVMLRGYLQRNLEESWGPVWAIALGSVIFSLAHGLNPGVSAAGLANIVLIGVLLGVSVRVTGQLWLASGFHVAWNWALCMLLSLPVSGLEVPGLATASSSAPTWLTGGDFGPEASPVLTLLLLACLAAALCSGRVRGCLRRNPPLTSGTGGGGEGARPMHPTTAGNLRSAYGGESMAHQRYIVWAAKAKKDGFANVERLFTAVSHSELVHAWNHFVKLRSEPGEATVIAGAAFGNGPTATNLEMAMDGEAYEIEEMYPAFIALAEYQEEEPAAHSMRNAMEAEKTHHALYARAKAAVEGGQDVTLGVLHVCDSCGATIEGEAPDTCPICGADKSAFIAFA